jgi:hypothetical protein
MFPDVKYFFSMKGAPSAGNPPDNLILSREKHLNNNAAKKKL